MSDPGDADPDDIICPYTGSYCTGRFCDDYGCAKEAWFFDDGDEP